MNRKIRTMTKTITTLSMILLSFTFGYSQKATAPKQDQMLKQQEETNAKIDEVLKQQKTLINMYGVQEELTDDLSKLSYAFGITFGESFKMQGLKEINYVAMTKGLQDGMSDAQPQMSVQEAQQFLNQYMSRMAQERAAAARKDGAAFLEKNGQRAEVKTTESGLQYEVMTEGKGDKPGPTSKVTVHYEGRLLDGQVFDSSYKRGQPATFGLNQVIKGWTEGLQLMTPGSKYRLYIPSQLAYGDQGAGQMIGPGETLIFDVELIEVE